MRVERTHVGSKIVGKENPPLARFSAGDLAGAGFAKQRGGVHLQKVGGLFNGQRSHGFSGPYVAARRIGRLDTTNRPLRRLTDRAIGGDFLTWLCLTHGETVPSRLFGVHPLNLAGAR
jgi:hypothetical protein